ncbi:hypothetical protein [Halosimplex amylolyticum]|uniref:hypothetical protein n=1 Tax=Halosimplex amylolyticum TaxID=3396616 RepID=UPI003F55AA49
MTGTPSSERTADRDAREVTDPIGRSVATDSASPTVSKDSSRRSPPSDASQRANDEAPDADAAIARIYDRADEIRTHEVETALVKLDATGDLAPEDRAAIEGLADRLVARLIAVPERGLRAAADDGTDAEDGTEDPAVAETALKLFG